MDKILLMSLTYLSIISFTFHLHPVFVCGTLALSALSISLTAALMFGTWFLYLLTLVFLGGVMVLIIYMSTLCTNEKTFYKNMKLFMVAVISSLSFILVPFSYSSLPVKTLSSPMSIFSSLNLIILMFTLTFLIIIMVSCVKLIKLESGPLSSRL